MHLYVGNWVVDDMGDYCKITEIVDDDEIWGYWSNNLEQALCTSADCIVGKYRTKKEAKMVADIIKQQCEDYRYEY